VFKLGTVSLDIFSRFSVQIDRIFVETIIILKFCMLLHRFRSLLIRSESLIHDVLYYLATKDIIEQKDSIEKTQKWKRYDKCNDDVN
jgi:hypothetical protein